MKTKASRGRSLGRFWSQIVRNKCSILILALKLPLLEWSQARCLLGSILGAPGSSCLLLCFPWGERNLQSAVWRFQTLNLNLRKLGSFQIWLSTRTTGRENSPWEICCPAPPTSSSSSTLISDMFPGLPLLRQALLCPIPDTCFTVQRILSDSLFTWKLTPSLTPACPSQEGQVMEGLHPATTMCPSLLSRAVWWRCWINGQRGSQLNFPLKTDLCLVCFKT